MSTPLLYNLGFSSPKQLTNKIMITVLELQKLYEGILSLEKCTWIEVDEILPEGSPTGTKWSSNQKNQTSRDYDKAVNTYLTKYSEFVQLPLSDDVKNANVRIQTSTKDLENARKRLKNASDTADAIASFMEVIDFILSLVPLGFVDPRSIVEGTLATSPVGDIDSLLSFNVLIDVVNKCYLIAFLNDISETDRLIYYGYAFRLHTAILTISCLDYSHSTELFIEKVTAISEELQIVLETSNVRSQLTQEVKALLGFFEDVVVYHP
jgi:hypothetical protein